jgi:hypothetical protein
VDQFSKDPMSRVLGDLVQQSIRGVDDGGAEGIELEWMLCVCQAAVSMLVQHYNGTCGLHRSQRMNAAVMRVSG